MTFKISPKFRELLENRMSEDYSLDNCSEEEHEFYCEFDIYGRYTEAEWQQFIQVAFDWAETPEGNAFWFDISENPIKMKKIKCSTL